MSLFLLQLKQELRKLFRRPRSYLGFGAFLAMECLMIALANRPESRMDFRRMLQEHGLAFDHYFSGLTLAAGMVTWIGFVPSALFLALVSGDIMATEAREGTLRMMLCRPVSRLRIAGLKYLSCALYTCGLILFLGATALAAGILTRGTGGLFIWSAPEHLLAWHEAGPGAVRLCTGIALLALGLTTIPSLGFLLSCLNIQPAAAVIATLAIVFLDFLFSSVPYFENFRPWFLSAHIEAWLQVFANPIPWKTIARDYLFLFTFNAACFALALGAFQRRDIKT